MAIAVRASGSTTWDEIGTQTTTVSRPSGTQAGDLMVAAWTYEGSTTPATPTGWTAVATGVGNATNKGACFYRVAQAGDVSWTFDAGSAVDHGGVLQTFSGVNTTTPIDATGTTSTNTGLGALTANAVTVATDQSWHLIASGAWNPGNFTATGFTVVDNGGAFANEAAALLYNTTPKSVGSTGTVSVACSGTTGGQVLTDIPFALRPVAGVTLTAAAGTFTETGQAATFAVTRTLTAATGSFAEAGRAAGLVVARRLAAATGSFTETGQAANLNRGKALVAAAGSFAATGQAAAFVLARRITADVGAFAANGQAATLTLRPAPAMNASVRVEWHYPLVRSPRVPTGFKVYVGVGTPDYTAPAAIVPYSSGFMNTFRATLSGLTDGTTYAVAVRAYNSSGEEQNGTVASVTAISAGPLPVDSLAATAVA